MMCVPATNLPLGVQGSLLFLLVLECTLWCAGVQFIFFPSVTINNVTDIYRWEASLSKLLPDFVFEV